MATFAFLRAVNLGKHNKVPMKQLMEVLASEVKEPVTYLLASGNLIFPDGAPADIAGLLRQVIAREFIVETDAIMRDSDGLRTLIDMNPYGVPETGSVQISIWDGEPSAEGLTRLAALEHAPDQLTLVPGAAIIRYADSSHDSKLSNNLVMRHLKVPATLRNVKTFIRLIDRYG